ncbi:hypothetical protein [Bosea sp. (in: a-proteobacteria)]|uniref:hypothetical protein n=1 Tax=Bosea sp. (in: a-proteobacteria) TaxID=1871050 RepID=UPI003B3B158D
MTREDFNDLSQDLLGRPVTAAEFQALLHAATTLKLGVGSPVATMLVLFQSLKSDIAAATADRTSKAEARAKARRRNHIGGWIIGAVLGLGCGCLGYTLATLQIVGRDRQALHWALTADGERARRMSDSGLLKALEDCSIPGWVRQDRYCLPGIDPATGTMRWIPTRNLP